MYAPIAVKNLLTAELWILCDDLPIGSRPSEILLEAAMRLERYRALTAEYAPRNFPLTDVKESD